MARMPIIRASGQQELTPMPRANAGALDIGGAVAGFGASVSGLADELSRQKAANKAKDRTNALRAARVETAERIGQAAAISAAEQDVDGLADRFGANANSIIDEIAGRFEGEDQEEYRLIGAEITAPHNIAIFGRQTQMRADIDRDRSSADINALITEYGRTSDPGVGEALLDQAASMIEQDFAAGIITEPERRERLEAIARQAIAGDLARHMRDNPEQGREFLMAGGGDYGPAERQELIKKFEREIESRKAAETSTELDAERARLIEETYENPARAIDLIDAGEFPLLASERPADLARARVFADGKRREREAAEIKQAQKAAEEHLAIIREQVEFAEDATAEGRDINDLPGLFELARGTPYEARVDALARDWSETADFRLLTPRQRLDRIAEARGRPADSKHNIGHPARLRERHEKMRASEQRDIIGHQEKYDLQEVPPVDLGDPDSLKERRQIALGLSAWHDVPPRFFSMDERDRILAQLKSSGPESKLALLSNLTAALGPDAIGPLAELEMGDPLFAHAGKLVLDTGSLSTAGLILSGQAIKAGGQAPRLPPAVRDGVLAEMDAGFALDKNLVGGQVWDAMLNAAEAVWIAEVQGEIDPAAPYAEEEMRTAFERALRMVTGATWDGKTQYGGFQDVRIGARVLAGIQLGGQSHTVLLPPSLTAQQLSSALMTADEAAWERAGQVPLGPDGQPLSQDERRNLVPRHVGAGLYEMGQVRGEVFEPITVTGEPGEVALFDLETLVAGARE